MTFYLAFDGGSTSTRAGLYSEVRRLVGECQGPPTNPLTCGETHCLDTLSALGRVLLQGAGDADLVVAAGISGAGRQSVREKLAAALSARLNARSCVVCDDLRPMLFANIGTSPGVVVVAGTGSSVVAQSGDGRSVLVGGRGRIFGDDGSAYQIVVAALRAAARAVDGIGPVTALAGGLVGAANQAHFADMPAWSEEASKGAIAALAKTVVRLAEEGDAVAASCVTKQAARLAEQAYTAHAALDLPANAVFLVHGGVFEGCARFREAFSAALRSHLPEASIRPPQLKGHRAVVELALSRDLPPGFPASRANLRKESGIGHTVQDCGEGGEELIL